MALIQTKEMIKPNTPQASQKLIEDMRRAGWTLLSDSLRKSDGVGVLTFQKSDSQKRTVLFD